MTLTSAAEGLERGDGQWTRPGPNLKPRPTISGDTDSRWPLWAIQGINIIEPNKSPRTDAENAVLALRSALELSRRRSSLDPARKRAEMRSQSQIDLHGLSENSSSLPHRWPTSLADETDPRQAPSCLTILIPKTRRKPQAVISGPKHGDSRKKRKPREDGIRAETRRNELSRNAAPTPGRGRQRMAASACQAMPSVSASTTGAAATHTARLKPLWRLPVPSISEPWRPREASGEAPDLAKLPDPRLPLRERDKHVRRKQGQISRPRRGPDWCPRLEALDR